VFQKFRAFRDPKVFLFSTEITMEQRVQGTRHQFEVDADTAREPHYIRQPFKRELDFAVVSVNFDLSELLARAEKPE
jgi:hypothetical protein